MSVQGPGNVNVAQKCMLAFAFILPAMIKALWESEALHRFLPGLTEHQLQLAFWICFPLALLGTCLFNTWLLAGIADLAPEKRRLKTILFGLFLLIMQILATPLMSLALVPFLRFS